MVIVYIRLPHLQRVGVQRIVADHRIKVIVPIPMNAAGVANRAAQLPPEVIAPGFKPEFAAVSWGAVSKLSCWSNSGFRTAKKPFLFQE